MEYINKIIHGNAFEVLKKLPAEIFYTCITSIPYWGLRDYGVKPLIWGNNNCQHEWGNEITPKQKSNWNTFNEYSENKIGQEKSDTLNKVTQGQFCSKCGAWRGSYGLEPTIELYIQHTVEIFRKVKRVLKKDGTLWLNLGDSYNSASSNQNGRKELKSTINPVKYYSNGDHKVGRRPLIPELKSKDLCGIPWRVALALQADGWYLRQDIIWAKPNPMPESVTDRCTKSHEYIFLLSKSAKYYYDADAIKEDSVDPESYTGRRFRNARAIATANARPYNKLNTMEKGNNADGKTYSKKNKRSVWTVSTQPYSGAHFATFPVDLIADCIKAGCPEGETVLDPFFGSGAVGEAALRLNRYFTGIELSQDYIKLADDRLKPFFMPDLFKPNLNNLAKTVTNNGYNKKPIIK